MQEYKEFWQRYFDFSGTTSRRGYWMAFLFNWLVAMVIIIVAGATKLSILSTLYTVAIIIPNLAITVRRLRDAGYAWGWIFINFVPLVGQIIYIVLLCQPSKFAPTQSASTNDPNSPEYWLNNNKY